ncbi:winged helix-turn-helix domain-containing protein [Yersinia nurmii]|uniref:Invasion protein regulator n=1 Tax=Yersinia nurmii TaxID=685706 RepID=A0AAW7JYT1_9GAMM|nr:winged helix-turn-helix domain-containing protein [Yersinia nurmii]MDN0086155.1 winged helix-turn-helix domain-containing protein [Yersinia nurmii]CND83145.1 invasion protein regulator [Yersinia nurmii]
MIQHEFGNYSLSYDGDLMHLNERILIPPKELALLRLFLDSREQLLSKDMIIEKIWHGVQISDESLTRCVYGLRRLLGGNKDYIVTVYGRGYRFVPPAKEKEASTLFFSRSNSFFQRPDRFIYPLLN